MLLYSYSALSCFFCPSCALKLSGFEEHSFAAAKAATRHAVGLLGAQCGICFTGEPPTQG